MRVSGVRFAPWLLFILTLPAAVGGCGRSGPAKAPVHGTVAYKGKPLPGALVVFMPDTENVLPASGLTDEQGRYVLMTLEQGDGCTVGKHRVTITARAAAKAAPGGGIAPGSAGGELLVPRKYTMADTSGLTAEVVPGENTKNFDLVP